MNEIQRWAIGEWDGGLRKVNAPPQEGDLVNYSDHLRAVTLAKIEVLEEMLSRLGGYSNSTKGYCEAKIAALRKELE